MCGICISANHISPMSMAVLIGKYSDDEMKRILGNSLIQERINAPLYENLLTSTRTKQPILLEAASEENRMLLNELAVWLQYKWPIGHRIKVKFINRNPHLEPIITGFTKQWETYANIHFDFVDDSNADIRISLKQDGTSWSAIGTSCLSNTNQNEATMNFGWFQNNTPIQEIGRTTLHEFGHALGCIHEHQSPAAGIPWNNAAVRRIYTSVYRWTEDEIERNLFTQFPATDITNSVYDPDSIMHYPVESVFTTTGQSIGLNTHLSAQDKAFIKMCYPF